MENIYARSKYDSLIAFAQNERVEHVTTLASGIPESRRLSCTWSNRQACSWRGSW